MIDIAQIIKSSVYMECSVVMLSQLIFIFTRTLNIIYTAERKAWASVITNGIISLSFLVTMWLGVGSLEDLRHKWPVLICSVIGSSLGTYYGIRLEKYFKKREDKGLSKIDKRDSCIS